MISLSTASPEETIAFAEQIGKLLRGGDIIAYRGGLGAGKTTFTRGIA
ncbi:MAG: tRNA (adenosine(37)-N6)-threonylcarbamoyltransferase complex ATPase subunit type 1 TsaE, partial [Oscillospiraceae bacterium]|nr:tRNA (adenosine(37)-N6)-threonylcarbamoyltransferase complex ATPase subunit type 1 TsaE [Oscillospiraceae bacterium]